MITFYINTANVVSAVVFISTLFLLYPKNNSNDLGYIDSIKRSNLPRKWKSKTNARECFINFYDNRTNIKNEKDKKIIYYVTPTYPRPEQTPELTRLSHTLMHVPRLHWIVADDQKICSQQVLSILQRSGLPFTHLSSPSPHKASHGRGVANRRAAIAWIHMNIPEGILYFGDDDNTVDLKLFDEIRKTKKISMFPVGLIGFFGVSAPVVNDGKVEGFFDSWPGRRTFPVDMAGFAINIKYLNPLATMPYQKGYLEDRFLVGLGIKMEDIEPLADNCTKVLVWHTKSLKHTRHNLQIDIDSVSKKPYGKNIMELLFELSKMEISSIDPDKGIQPFIIKKSKAPFLIS